MKAILLPLLMIAILASAQEVAKAQDADENNLSLKADIVSRYVWRGLLYSSSPNIQPTIDYTRGNLSVGAWGSYAIGMPYAEVDLYLSYSTSNFSFTLNNYFVEDETNLQLNNYFNWNKKNTPHSLEGSISFNGTEKFPVSLTAATFFYGNDWDESGDNNYSTYFEVGYSRQIGNMELKLFAGGTPAKGLYAQKAALVNIGLGLSHELVINDSFKIPVFATFVINPSAQDIFLVFGITL